MEKIFELKSQLCESFSDENHRYVFTINNTEIEAYCALRKKTYFDMYGDDNVNKDEYDIPGNILVALKGNEVIGGIRVITVLPHETNGLPLKNYGFNLESLIPDIFHYKHCELDRLCVAAIEGCKTVGEKLTAIALKSAHIEACRYLFACASPPLTRYYQRLTTKLGFNYVPTSQKVTLETAYNSVELVLSKVDFEDGKGSSPVAN